MSIRLKNPKRQSPIESLEITSLTNTLLQLDRNNSFPYNSSVVDSGGSPLTKFMSESGSEQDSEKATESVKSGSGQDPLQAPVVVNIGNEVAQMVFEGNPWGEDSPSYEEQKANSHLSSLPITQSVPINPSAQWDEAPAQPNQWGHSSSQYQDDNYRVRRPRRQFNDSERFNKYEDYQDTRERRPQRGRRYNQNEYYPRRRPSNQHNRTIDVHELIEMFPNIPGGVIQECMSTHSRQGRDFIIEFLRDYQERILPSSQETAIFLYKTRECMARQLCKDTYCPDYHSLGERRRNINTTNYSSIMCKSFLNCPRRNECTSAHTVNEVLYHPNVYQSVECTFAKPDGSCLFARVCPYLHNKNSKPLPQTDPLNDKIETQIQELEKLRNSVNQKTVELEKLQDMNCVGCRKPYIVCLQQGCSS